MRTPWHSNYASEAATLFWRNGEIALGKLFAEGSVGLQTGSAWAMDAERLLATLDKDWKSAARIGRAIHERYGDTTSLAIATWFGVIAGDTDVDADLRTILRWDRSGWTGRIDTARLRMAGRDAATTRQAVETRRFPVDEEDVPAWVRAWYATEALLLDRQATEEDLESIRKVAGATAQAHAAIARGYVATRSGDHETALRLLRTVYPSSRSVEALSAMWGHALPSLVHALVNSGLVDEARRLLDDRRHGGFLDTYYYQGKALVAHADGRPDAAVQALWEAFVKLPSFGWAPIPQQYAVLETAEGLYLQSRDKRYLALLRNLAVRSALVWPTGWAHAFIALYAEEPSVRAEAAAVALRLDPKSARLANVPAAILDDARARLAKGNPRVGAAR